MKRPYVIVNCAMSADGKIASPTRKQIRISGEEDIARMYRLRNDCDAVLVGIETILADDPKLTVKEKYVQHPKQPLRVILDSNARTPPHALALNDVSKTLVIIRKGKQNHFLQQNVEVIECDSDKNGYLDVHHILDILHRKGVKKLLVEGGGTVIWTFLQNKVVDDLFIFIGPCIIGGKDSPTVADGKGMEGTTGINLRIVDVQRLGLGLLIHYQLDPHQNQ
jgi:2,5-diamino-6-(ribosylamino)-4(3H)-pyrimidinone 5'-phosphate reductase